MKFQALLLVRTPNLGTNSSVMVKGCPLAVQFDDRHFVLTPWGLGKLKEASIWDGKCSLGLSYFEVSGSPSSFVPTTSRGHEKLSEGYEHTHEGSKKLLVYLGGSNGVQRRESKGSSFSFL